MRLRSPIFCATAPFSTQPQTVNHGRRMSRCLLTLLPALLILAATVVAQAQEYTKIVVFGDSLSDTGNDAILSFHQFGVPIPGPVADYTLGRFTDGPDTLPPAMNHFGVWVEQLADALPSHPMVVASLEGGTNYAFGFAKTGSGTTPLIFKPGFSIDVHYYYHGFIGRPKGLARCRFGGSRFTIRCCWRKPASTMPSTS